MQKRIALVALSLVFAQASAFWPFADDKPKSRATHIIDGTKGYCTWALDRARNCSSQALTYIRAHKMISALTAVGATTLTVGTVCLIQTLRTKQQEEQPASVNV